jgi:hypothetical protein
MQIQLRLRRNRDGLLVTVHGAPVVEQFFQNLAGEAPLINVNTVARYWTPIGEGAVLEAYPLSADISATSAVPGEDRFWSLNMLGKPLLSEHTRLGAKDLTVNLSVLRLKGISAPSGVSFTYRGLMGEDQMRTLASEFHRAAAHFYNTYLCDVDITLRVNKED